jgi:hypothetical protein
LHDIFFSRKTLSYEHIIELTAPMGLSSKALMIGTEAHLKSVFDFLLAREGDSSTKSRVDSWEIWEKERRIAVKKTIKEFAEAGSWLPLMSGPEKSLTLQLYPRTWRARRRKLGRGIVLRFRIAISQLTCQTCQRDFYSSF